MARFEVDSSSGFGFGIRHLQLLCMFLCVTTLYIGRGCMAVAVLAMTDTSRSNETNIMIYDWDKQTQGIILSSFFWGYVVMQIPGGILSKKFGGKIILLIALLANGVLCLLLPLLAKLGDWPLVCTTRVIMGLSQACLFPTTHTLLGRWFPAHERDFCAGLVVGGGQLGTIVVMPVSGLLASTAAGWKLIYYAISGVMFIVAIIWYFFAASVPAEHRMITIKERNYIEKVLNISKNQTGQTTPWKNILMTKELWACCITNITLTMVFTLFFVDIPTYLERGLHISLKNSATLSALPFVGMWIGTMASNYLSQKLINHNVVSTGICRKIFNSIGAVGTACCLLSLSFMEAHNRVSAIVVITTCLFFCGCNGAGYMVNLLDLSPNFAGVLLGLTNTFGNIGALLTPIGTSLALGNDTTNLGRWRILFIFYGVFTIITNILYVIFSTSRLQEWDNPDFSNRRDGPEEPQSVLEKKKLEK